jgi:hypothetical protein
MQAASAPPTCIHDYYEMRGAKRLEADCKERVAAIAPLEPFEGDSVFRLANDGSVSSRTQLPWVAARSTSSASPWIPTQCWGGLTWSCLELLPVLWVPPF